MSRSCRRSRRNRLPKKHGVAVATGGLGTLEDLSAAADPYSPDACGDTPLHQAAKNGDVGAVECLLATGTVPDTRDGDGATPLQLAVMGGHARCVSALLAAGADVNGSTNEAKSFQLPPVLHLAAMVGDRPIVERLLAAGADPNQMDGSGATALDFAILYANVAVVRVLLSAGADPSAEDALGYTSLHYAVRRNNADVIQILLPTAAGQDIATIGERIAVLDHARSQRISVVQHDFVGLRYVRTCRVPHTRRSR